VVGETAWVPALEGAPLLMRIAAPSAYVTGRIVSFRCLWVPAHVREARRIPVTVATLERFGGCDGGSRKAGPAAAE